MLTTQQKSNDQPNLLRRKLFQGAYAGVGVLMAVQAKTALGCQCVPSPSAQISGNTSPRPGPGTTCVGGRSPGFWKVPQHFDQWVHSNAIPATFTVGVSVCTKGMQGLTVDNISMPGTLLTSIFTGASNVGVWQVLAFPQSVNNGELLRHLSAAWLNAGYPWPDGTYPLTQVQVISMWTQLNSSSFYCPVGMTCAPTKAWDRNQVIGYITSLYDINAGTLDDPDLCKKH